MPVFRLLRTFTFLFAIGLALLPAMAKDDVHGLPFLRIYPYEEIEYASRSGRLTFDAHGRVAVVREGAFVVLNDESWLNLAREGDIGMVRLRFGPDGRHYFGARGVWGTAEADEQGVLRPHLLVPGTTPEWVGNSYFDDLIAHDGEVYLGSWNGVVIVSTKTGASSFQYIKNQRCLVNAGGRVFATTINGDYIDVTQRGSISAPGNLKGPPPLLSGSLSNNRALLCTDRYQLVTFDGVEFGLWGTGSDLLAGGITTAICRTPEGKIAIAQTGRGLFLFDEFGELIRAYTSARFKQISDLASNEVGVLWMATDEAVIKLIHDCPIENFGHELGLSPRWPVLSEFDGITYIVSEGRLYKVGSDPVSRTAQVEELKFAIPGGAWAIASTSDSLLVGNGHGIYSYKNERAEQIISFTGMTNMALVENDTLILASGEEVAAFQRREGIWTEAAPRIRGFAYSPIAETSSSGLWLELANKGVAKISLDASSQQLKVDVLHPWLDAGWTSMSLWDGRIMLTGGPGQRRFYDQRTLAVVEEEGLEQALDKAPNWVVRISKNHHGFFWGTTSRGLVALFPEGDNYRLDTRSYDYINDLYPVVNVLPSGAAWITANQSLYRINDPSVLSLASRPKIRIVSAFDTVALRERGNMLSPPRETIELPADSRGLSLRLFSGSYRSRRPASYIFRLNSGPWQPIDSGSLLGLRELGEGSYHVEARFADTPEDAETGVALSFAIAPPWYRSPLARAGEVILGIVIFFVAVRFSSRVVRRRNESLERLVSERTSQLEKTMDRLHEETRTAATLAERNRIAGEIHDSLQQGLTGAMLQLDSTMNLPLIEPAVRSRLNIVRNMISFTRHEVQNAVWDKESPLLGDGELGEALHKLTAFINSDANRVQVSVAGDPCSLPTEVKHHLLRIAQEATTNAVRHARASEIAIVLHYKENEMVMSVSDNGIGFDPGTALNLDTGHFGLRGLKSRARRLNGNLILASAPGHGTRITVSVPICRPSNQ